MKKQHLFYFTGASGTGKTTLLNYIRENYPQLVSLEVSARPYLPKTGSYDQTLTDELQALIVQHRTLSTLDVVLGGKSTVFSRGALDNLAYQRVLEKGVFLDGASKREIEIAKKHGAIFLYIPVEFEMSENDTQRGTNRPVQLATDKEIANILVEFNIPAWKITGTVKERCAILDTVFSTYGFYKEDNLCNLKEVAL